METIKVIKCVNGVHIPLTKAVPDYLISLSKPSSTMTYS